MRFCRKCHARDELNNTRECPRLADGRQILISLATTIENRIEIEIEIGIGIGIGIGLIDQGSRI